MRVVTVSILVAGLAAFMATAGDPPAQKTGPFADLKAEFDKAMKKAHEERVKAAEELRATMKKNKEAAEKALEEAKTDDEKKAARELVRKAKAPPAELPAALRAEEVVEHEFSKRFFEFAEKHPTDPDSFTAIRLALNGDPGSYDPATNWPAIIKFLRTNYATKPEIKRLLPALARVDDDATNELIHDVMEHNPDRVVQAKAYRSLVSGLTDAVQAGKQLKSNAKARERYEKNTSKAYAERMIERIDRNRKEADELRKIMMEKYGDIIPDLSIGKPAPEVISQDVDGKPVKLSDLKGKVVVIDIWATWCGPCKAMIPHEREMVERLKDKPFVLVGISADDDKKTLTDFLAKEKLPWTHWWSGPETGIVEDWDIEGFPTIFILDAQGVIRFRDLREEKLEEAVNKLLKEMESSEKK